MDPASRDPPNSDGYPAPIRRPSLRNPPSLEIDDHDILVSDHPGIVPGRQERDIARLAHQFRSVIHHDLQGSRHVVLEMGGFATLCFCDRLDGLGPTPPGSSVARPMVAPPIVINSTLPFGKFRTSSALEKSFFFRFPCHILVLPSAVRSVSDDKFHCPYEFDELRGLEFLLWSRLRPRRSRRENLPLRFRAMISR